MARHVVRHVAVQEGEGFDLLPGESVVSAEYDGPYFHLVLLLEDDDVDGVGALVAHIEAEPLDGQEGGS